MKQIDSTRKKIFQFGTEMTDGRLTENPSTDKFDMLSAYKLRKSIGRELTAKELDQFRR